MVWVLVSEDDEIELTENRTLGRADFPDDPLLSRKHAEFTIFEEQIYVTDLGSTNGTTLRGAKIRAKVANQMQVGDVVIIGKVQLKLEQGDYVPRRFSPKLLAQTIGGVFAVMMVLTICRPSVAWGLAFQLPGILLISGWLLVSVVLGTVLADILGKKWKGMTPRRFIGVVFVVSIAVSQGMMDYLNYDWQLNEFLVQNRIEYFCINHFEGTHCIDTINTCTACAGHMTKWKQDRIMTQLGPYTQQLLEATKRLPATPTNAPAPSHQ